MKPYAWIGHSKTKKKMTRVKLVINARMATCICRLKYPVIKYKLIFNQRIFVPINIEEVNASQHT